MRKVPDTKRWQGVVGGRANAAVVHVAVVAVAVVAVAVVAVAVPVEEDDGIESREDAR